MNARDQTIRRFSSRLEPLDKSFLCRRLRGAQAYDRIAGYFCSSLLEVAGEELESVTGPIRMVCNSELSRADLQTARAAQMGVRREWCAFEPEKLLETDGGAAVRDRYARLYRLLKSGKLQVRVLPDEAFGLIHGKAGVITLADGSKTCFLGSANESKSAWRLNYELVWEDRSSEAVQWVQEEFDALWNSPAAVPLAEFVVEDLARLAEREVVRRISDWIADREPPDPAPAVVEAPVYRREVGLWEHQKYFVKLVFDEHHGPTGKARFVLADQVGLGKTLQLATSALLIALTGERPILVICPKTLVWQWQGEMRDLLGMPSAVWDGRRWVDERGIEWPSAGPESILKCPRRVGIVSSGLVTRRSEAASHLLRQTYDCVVLDEAHRARRRNLGKNRDGEAPQPNNLLAFMYKLAERTRTLLLATATPVQLRPVEAWDLLDVLSRGDESVLGNAWSRWRKVPECLELIMGRAEPPKDMEEQWEWVRNPMPPKWEHHDFEVLRNRLDVPDSQAVVPGSSLAKLRPPDRGRLSNLFPRFLREHHPFIRRIVRRSREQLENQIDPETKEPLLRRIEVRLLGESDEEAIPLPPYLREAYQKAEDFCEALGKRMKGSGFLKTLLLRRVGSSIYAGLRTAQKMLEEWQLIETEPEEEEEDELLGENLTVSEAEVSRTLTPSESSLLEQFIDALQASQERDPKYAVVRACLLERGWLELGCIVFSQYRDSIQWLAEQLTEELPDESIAVYSGPQSSGIMRAGQWSSRPRDELKQLVMKGRIRLLLGTDAASEGLNLQRLARLINLDLPWNPTRLEQRKGRIQRIGQVHDVVEIYNMRYKDSVEDRVHELLSERLHDIFSLFGQIPDVLEDVWVAVALGEKERAKKIIDELPKVHPFELRYTHVQKIDWESCRRVLDKAEIDRLLTAGW
ncbi:MAG: DEAD/DEAH box helicase family protein [Planctomycetes bacterium]|nr:DEAD/DEAH box helicase family protein [Planctomycetota bacterium]